MSKAQDSKKAVKKEPAKTMKEKKADKKVKKEAMKRQWCLVVDDLSRADERTILKYFLVFMVQSMSYSLHTKYVVYYFYFAWC